MMLRRTIYILLAVSTVWLIFKCRTIDTSTVFVNKVITKIHPSFPGLSTLNQLHAYTTRNDSLDFKRKIWKNCTNNTTGNQDLMNKFFDGKYLLKNCQICGAKDKLKLVILVISAPGNFYQRNAIRMSWGHYALRRDISISFVIAIKKWRNNPSHNNIRSEIYYYNDIIIPQYKDRYEKLTLKTIFILDWASSCCSLVNDLYILKTDDDMLINVPLLLRTIKSIEAQDKIERKIYGDIHGLNYPYRDHNEKYGVSCDQYPYLMYPNFTSGPAYLFSHSLARPLLSRALETPYLKLEDVFLTGIVAETLGIPRVHLSSFTNEVNKSLITKCKINQIVTLMIQPLTEDQFVAWSLCNIMN